MPFGISFPLARPTNHQPSLVRRIILNPWVSVAATTAFSLSSGDVFAVTHQMPEQRALDQTTTLVAQGTFPRKSTYSDFLDNRVPQVRQNYASWGKAERWYRQAKDSKGRLAVVFSAPTYSTGLEKLEARASYANQTCNNVRRKLEAVGGESGFIFMRRPISVEEKNNLMKMDVGPANIFGLFGKRMTPTQKASIMYIDVIIAKCNNNF
jgi:hypothetical protein